MAEIAPAPGENEIAHAATKKVSQVENVMIVDTGAVLRVNGARGGYYLPSSAARDVVPGRPDPA